MAVDRNDRPWSDPAPRRNAALWDFSALIRWHVERQASPLADLKCFSDRHSECGRKWACCRQCACSCARRNANVRSPSRLRDMITLSAIQPTKKSSSERVPIQLLLRNRFATSRRSATEKLVGHCHQVPGRHDVHSTGRSACSAARADQPACTSIPANGKQGFRRNTSGNQAAWPTNGTFSSATHATAK